MQRFREILVVARPEEDTPQVVARAAELAERNRARLTLFDVVPELDGRRSTIEHGGSTIDLQQLLLDARRQELEELAGRVMTVETRVAVASGVPFVAIIQRVLGYHHDLVITAPDGEAPGRGLRGATTTLHLLRKCPSPVWVDDPRTWGRRDVVVALGPLPEDGDDTLNQTLLQLGSSLARIQRGAVHVVHAWRFQGEQLLRSRRARLRSSVVDALVDEERITAEKRFAEALDAVDLSGVEAHGHLRHGTPSDVISDVVDAAQPGVVVMGTLARAGLRGLIIGNTAERVLGDLEASVIAVKPPGFESPVTLD